MTADDFYTTRKDFVAYFLQLPVTKEPEFEIKISGTANVVNAFLALLKQKGVAFRRIGLEIFPPPLMVLLERNSIKEALGVLHVWLKNNREQGIQEIKFIRPDGSAQNILNEQHIVRAIAEI